MCGDAPQTRSLRDRATLDEVSTGKKWYRAHVVEESVPTASYTTRPSQPDSESRVRVRGATRTNYESSNTSPQNRSGPLLPLESRSILITYVRLSDIRIIIIFHTCVKISKRTLGNRRTANQVRCWWNRFWFMYQAALVGEQMNDSRWTNYNLTRNVLDKFKQSEIFALIHAAYVRPQLVKRIPCSPLFAGPVTMSSATLSILMSRYFAIIMIPTMWKTTSSLAKMFPMTRQLFKEIAKLGSSVVIPTLLFPMTRYAMVIILNKEILVAATSFLETPSFLTTLPRRRIPILRSLQTSVGDILASTLALFETILAIHLTVIHLVFSTPLWKMMGVVTFGERSLMTTISISLRLTPISTSLEKTFPVSVVIIIIMMMISACFLKLRFLRREI
jgi:hypothetical protein